MKRNRLRVKISHALHDWPQYPADSLPGSPLANHMDTFSLCRMVRQLLERQHREKDGFYPRSLLIGFKVPVAAQDRIVAVPRKPLLFHTLDKSKWQAGSALQQVYPQCVCGNQVRPGEVPMQVFQRQQIFCHRIGYPLVICHTPFGPSVNLWEHRVGFPDYNG